MILAHQTGYSPCSPQETTVSNEMYVYTTTAMLIQKVIRASDSFLVIQDPWHFTTTTVATITTIKWHHHRHPWLWIHLQLRHQQQHP